MTPAMPSKSPKHAARIHSGKLPKEHASSREYKQTCRNASGIPLKLNQLIILARNKSAKYGLKEHSAGETKDWACSVCLNSNKHLHLEKHKNCCCPKEHLRTGFQSAGSVVGEDSIVTTWRVSPRRDRYQRMWTGKRMQRREDRKAPTLIDITR